jgi:hypothetical protein
MFVDENQINCYCASERFNFIFLGLQTIQGRKNFIASTLLLEAIC